MDNSPLSSIPPELRNQILELLLVGSRGKIWLAEGRIANYGGDVQSAKNAIALAATCRQLRQETLPVFYGANTFLWYPATPCCSLTTEKIGCEIERLKAWVNDLGPTAQLVRVCKIWMGTWSPTGPYQGRKGIGAKRLARMVFGLWQAFKATNTRVEVDIRLKWFTLDDALDEAHPPTTADVVFELPFSGNTAMLLADEVAEVRQAISAKADSDHLDPVWKYWKERLMEKSFRGFDRMLSEIKQLQRQ